MKRPANSRVKHGMASCVRYGCQRPECLRARRIANNENYREVKEQRPARVSSEEARMHALLLVRARMSPLDIAERSGVSPEQVRRLLRGELPGMLRVNSEAILGIPLSDEGRPGREDGLTDATGARRRLQALAIQGFSIGFLHEESAVTRVALAKIRSNVQEGIRLSTLRVIVVLHDKLWDANPLDVGLNPNGVIRAKKYAERKGWYPTEAWADIDDPECKPILRTPRYVALTEDAQELISTQGYDRKCAAERLGVKRDTLNAAMAYYAKAKAAS